MCIQRWTFWIIYSWLGSLLVLTRDVNLKVLKQKSGLPDPRTILVNVSANASDCLANTAWRRAFVHKNLGKKRSVYFIFMVDPAAASSFVLFHAARNLELLRMMLPRTRVGNFGVKKFSFPVCFYEFFFNTKIYNVKICNTNISDLRHISFMTQVPSHLGERESH